MSTTMNHPIIEQVRANLADRKNGTTLSAIRDATGVDIGTLSRLQQNGTPRLSVETASKLLNYFGYELRTVRIRRRA
jgi:transcriptional regulator with XRE-family HTH domain